MIDLRIYSRPGCHLCDEMKAVVDEVLRSTAAPAVVNEVDISGDATLEARYGLEIPVLELNGRKVAKYRISQGDLRRLLTNLNSEL